MAGIRSKNTNFPYVFRYPEWEGYVAYPAGSVVSFPNDSSDSETVYWDFYVAVRDVSANEAEPDKNSLKWKRTFDSTSVQSDSDVIAALSNLDSDVKTLYSENDNHDSDHAIDIAKLNHDYIAADSDLLVYLNAANATDKHNLLAADSDQWIAIDSDRIATKDADSDLWAAIKNIKLEVDSDNVITRSDHDSDLLQTYHDYQAADSDIINNLVADIDSDLKRVAHDSKSSDSDILYRLDSEVRSVIHDYLANDSDITGIITDVIHDYLSNDSEIDSDTLQNKHDIASLDSDIKILISENKDSDLAIDLDSEILALKSADSDIRIEIQSVQHDYKASDSDLRKDVDSDLRVLTNNISTIIDSDLRILREKDSDIIVQISDIDSDLAVIIHNSKAGDSDIVNILVADIDSDLAVITHNSQASDSDLRVDLDSEVRVIIHDYLSKDSDITGIITDVVHDYLASDSDIKTVTEADHDSDLKKVTHDYLASDSDLLYTVLNNNTSLDSEIHDRKAGDSDLRKYLDSEIQVFADIDSDFRSAYEKDYDSDVKVLLHLDSEIRHDVDSDLRNRTLNGLADVSIDYAPEHNTILAWDSDSEIWTAQDLTVTASGATWLNSQLVVASEYQTQFRTDYFPAGSVDVFRNGLLLPSTSIAVNGKDVTYYPANNFNSQIDSEDEVRLVYNRATSVAFSAELNDLTDVDTGVVFPEHGHTLVYDSDLGAFVPSLAINELQSKVAQLEADRDSDTIKIQSLQKQVNDNDSDIDQKGYFFVQPNAPTGYKNSGWVDTNTMRLYAWDTTNQIWIQISTNP